MRKRPNVAPMPAKPDDADPIENKISWLLDTHGYDARADRVVMLYEPSHYCTMVLKAFQTLYMPWWIEETGPQGGVKRKHAFAAWMLHVDRCEIAGVRLRPDMPFPCYLEDEQLFKNTYRRPQHTAVGGDIEPWLKFIEHLIPDINEREWFYDWLAHKYINPHIPGVAVIMVAAGVDGPIYGTGRGKLKEILSRLMGPRYVKPIDFAVFAGKSGQADFTDWAAYATMVIVSESKDTLESGKWASQRAVYERIKEIVDPRPVMRTFTMKNKQAFEAIAFTSYLVFSNNFDPLQIPDNDRRVTAIANGVQMKPEMAQALDDWMDVPANIAALGEWLESSDLSKFDPYAPLKTLTKTRMQAMSRSEFDDAIADIRRIVGINGLFTRPQIQAAVAERMDGGDGINLITMIRSQVRRITTEVPSKAELRVEIGGLTRQRVYCWIGYAGPVVQNTEGAREMVKATEKKLQADETDNPKDTEAAAKRTGFGFVED